MEAAILCLVFALAGLSCCFALFFALELLHHDAREECSSKQPLGMELGLSSVAPSNAFRETITKWYEFGVSQQISAIDEFREVLEGRGQRVPDDLTCLRFLRARQMRVGKALAMYECYWAWYTSDVAGRVMTLPIDQGIHAILQRSYPASLIGRDHLGRPVKLMDVGQLDMSSLRKQGIKESHLVDYHIREMELLARCLSLRDESTVKDMEARPGPDVDASLRARDPLLGHLSIFDTYNCTMSKFLSAITLWTELAKIDQNNYPELLGHALFVRPPRLFMIAFKTMKRLLDPLTASKFEVISGDPFDRIAELVGPENVPSVYHKHHTSAASTPTCAAPGQCAQHHEAQLARAQMEQKQFTWCGCGGRN